eukprot:GHVR01027083.1.p1 GENE.GHVR01027083.1~~GHVR01027083.1.p1  ORF type:complete len:281 (-),score=-1.74 GHVR01027083.1:174-1016(-)
MTTTPKGLAKIIRPFYRKSKQHSRHGKLDFVIVLSGPRGLGKSTIALLIKKELAPRASLEGSLIYSKKTLLEKISKEKEQFIDVDEAINVVFKREFYEHNQISILQDLDTYRSNHNCITFLIPDFWDLDSKLLNSSLIKIWIYIKRWGEAYIMRPTNKQFSRDPWNFDLNVKLEAKGQIYQSPNYMDTLIWKELPKDEYEKYDAIKAVKREEARQERTQQYDLNAKQKSLMQRRLSLIKLCLKYGIKNGEISQASGMSAPAISRITHSSKELIENSTEDI